MYFTSIVYPTRFAAIETEIVMYQALNVAMGRDSIIHRKTFVLRERGIAYCVLRSLVRSASIVAHHGF